MSFGEFVEAANFEVPNAEIRILLSVLILSVLIIRKTQFSAPLNVQIIAFFVFFMAMRMARKYRLRQI
ncbi:MAG: HupE/UreJ family protein [Nitrosomonas sp.]|nr:HupE/UreJ family protein [Nitrosomonas sp.]